MTASRASADFGGASVDMLRVRKVLGRAEWGPPRPILPGSWGLVRRDRGASVVVSEAVHDDGVSWVHASVAGDQQRGPMPTYDDLVLLHSAVFDGGYAYQVFAPPAQHVNIHGFALHLWGRADGAPVLPEFGRNGTI